MIALLQSNPYSGYEQSSGLMAMFGVGTFIVLIILYLFFGFCLYKIFQKAGREDAWAAFVPIYNNIILADVVKKPWWFGVLMIIPYVNIIFLIWAMNRLSKAFGQGTGFTVGLVLLGFIFLPLLAFGNYTFNGSLITEERN